jgi:RNA polymerase sigma-70 factor (ECF subfamily)
MDSTRENTNLEIATRIGAGDRAAEGELVERYGQVLLRLLLRLTRDRALSEDLHQETFRIVIERLRRRVLSEPDKLPRFILRTGRNLALSQRRKSIRQGESTAPQEDLLDPAQGQLERMLRREQAEILYRLLSEMSPDRYRQILVRFYIAEEEKSRICSDLGVSPIHFNCLLFRARQRLKELLETSNLSHARALQ